jgi:hypothetical protein
MVAAFGAALVSAVVYRDILRGYFFNDDFSWLFLRHEGGLLEFLITPMGGHSLVLRNAVMALHDAVAPLDPRPWFATVLATHALNAALLARLVWLLTGSAVAAGMAGLAWGTCPGMAETLSWYAVYGQVAATTCVLLAFGRVASLRRIGAIPSARDLAIVGTLLLLSSLFFGTALAVAVAFPVVMALLVPGSVRGARALLGVLLVVAVVVGLYVALQLLGAWLFDAYPRRMLPSLVERAGLAMTALAQLLRVGVTSLALGAWWTPAREPDVVSWVVLGLSVVGFAVAVWCASPWLRATMAAFLILTLATYGLIAVGRTGLALQLRPGQVAATMRYHYAPLLYLVVATAAASCVLPRRARVGAALGWVLLLLAGTASRGIPIDLHDASRAAAARGLEGLRAGIASTPPGRTAYLRNVPVDVFGILPSGQETPPGLAALFVIAFPADLVDGRTVRFVESRPMLRAEAERRDGRTAGLLVSPFEARLRALQVP